MLTAELDYFLPPELIAQEPVEPRDQSRLLVLRRGDGSIAHHRFDQLPPLLRSDDLLIFNDTRVLRARLRGYKSASGGRVEALLLREIEVNLWEALLKPAARVRPGTALHFVSADESVVVPAQTVERTEVGWLVRFFPGDASSGAPHSDDLRDWLPQVGEVPLPPYIRQAPRDEAQYQTVYARETTRDRTEALDSAAAPTAGLHFTPALLEALRARGIRTAFVTLGVGIGTFRPIQSETLEEHTMHREAFEIPAATARAVAEQRQRGGRVVAVGTTTTRVLESVADENGYLPATTG
ncbi:MAG: S-adenosylmethionine:tRNA ribosyltransferase-isomerase, partial [Armatimonadota bacterium]|nr:S-adenosylmethionine:tRNA ribosyltransferase-isomerase [Armatimonadota bacterium]